MGKEESATISIGVNTTIKNMLNCMNKDNYKTAGVFISHKTYSPECCFVSS